MGFAVEPQIHQPHRDVQQLARRARHCADVPRYSLNTTDKDELREAADLIIAGKPVYQGIWMDQILEKLPSEEIVAAPYYNAMPSP